MNWKEIVGTVAPTLGTALGGPLGGIAGKFLADKLGVDVEQLESQVETASPETLLQIKKIEADFKVEMKRLGIQKEQLMVEDRASARKMAIDTSVLPQVIIGTIFILGFVLILKSVFSGDVTIPEDMKDIANYLLGILSAGIVQVMNFFLGSSAGSKMKDSKGVVK